MNTNIIEIVNNMGQKSVGVAKELNEVNNRVFSKFMDQQLKVVSQAVESGIEQSQSLGRTRSIEELVETQKTLLQVNASVGLETARQWVELLDESRDAYFSIIGESVAFVQPVKKTRATKKAA